MVQRAPAGFRRGEIGPRLVEGRIVATDETGAVWVDFRGNKRAPVQARLSNVARLTGGDWMSWPGRSVLLLACEPPDLPIVVDFVEGDNDASSNAAGVESIRVSSDGKQLCVEGRERIVLRCGKASITLTRAGKVLIRGTYLSSRSSGVCRMNGGSVQIN